MPDYKIPKVYTQEKPGLPIVSPASTNIACMVGTAERGPLYPVFIDHPKTWVNRYGGSYSGSYSLDAINGFYGEGGNRMYFIRVVGSGSATAQSDVVNLDGNAGLRIKAENPGAWGNRVRVSSVRFETELDVALPAGAVTQMTLKSVRELNKGDILWLDDGTNTLRAHVLSYDTATRVVDVMSNAPLAAGMAVGTSVLSNTQHRATTQLLNDIPAGNITEFEVTDARNIQPQQILWIGDGTNKIECIVQAVNGDVVMIDDTAFPALSAATSLVVSQEFYMNFTYKGEQPEASFEYLSMNEDNITDYIENRYGAESNISIYIELEDLAVGGSLVNLIPRPFKDASLAGGLDGATPVDDDYIGSNTTDPKTGIYAVDDLYDVSMLVVPGITTVTVQKFLQEYIEGSDRRDMIAITSAPFAKATPQDVRDYKNFDLNIDSSYVAFYYPWLEVRDPDSSTLTKYAPPDARMAGVYARVGDTRGIQKSPSNEPLFTAVGLVRNVSDGEQSILHPEGINCIRSFRGRGIRVNGGRTMQFYKDGKHYISIRRVLNFVKTSLRVDLGWVVEEPNTEQTRSAVTTQLTQFLSGLWAVGMLGDGRGENTAYYVKCDSENNTQADVDQGILRIDVGVNPPKPAEFVVLSLELWNGSVSINEKQVSPV
jgi:hypothetical protein